MATDPMQSQFGGRQYPIRVLGGQYFGVSWKLASASQSSNKNLLLGFVNQAQYISVGVTAAKFIVTAGADFPGIMGENLSIAVSAASSTLLVSLVGTAITIRPASGGSTAAAVVTAFNAAIPAGFAVAALVAGSAGGTNITASQTARFFVADYRTP